MKIFLASYVISSSNTQHPVGGVITASFRSILSHKKLFGKDKLVHYKYCSKRLNIFLRLIVDLFNMLRLSWKCSYVYILTDNNSFVRSFLFILILRLISLKKILVDIRGGGDLARLNGYQSIYKTPLLFLIYTFSHKIVIQTPSKWQIPSILREKTFFLPNTIVVPRAEIKASRPSSRLSVVYSGRINRSKGIFNLITLAKSTSDFCDYTLLGPTDFASRSDQREFFNLLSTASNIYYNLPILDHSQLLIELASHNCLIFLSTHATEGIPNSILDAISINLPVISSKVGFLYDIYSDKHISYVDPTDIASISQLLSDFMYDNSPYLNKAQAAFNLSRQFTSESYIYRLSSLYSSFN